MATSKAMLIDACDLCATLITKVCEGVKRERMDRVWTKAALDALRSMGEARGFTVSADREDAHGILLDVVWWDNADLMNIVLAMESDWGSNAQIWHDFGKLMWDGPPRYRE